jgi:hypothetical protein
LHALISGGAVNYGAENLGGTFTGSNAYAMGTAVLVFFMIFFYRNIVALCRLKLVPQIVANYKTLLKMLFLLIIIGSIYNVVSLFSRGSAISLFCGFVTLFFLTSKKLKATFLVIPLTLILLVTIPIPDNYKERIASAFSEKEDLDSSAASRPYFWGIANSIVQDYPTGVGFNCYRYFYNYYRTGPADGRLFRDVHSSHFNALADAGYAGAAVWLSIFLFSFVRLLRLRRSLQGKEDEVAKIYISLVTLIICSQVVFVLGGSFYTLTYMDLIWWIWGLTLILTKLITKHQPISDKALS